MRRAAEARPATSIRFALRFTEPAREPRWRALRPSAEPGCSRRNPWRPALHGLQFTQPFHDKRVVELALAIPEDLYFRDGRQRYLARTALADLLPTEFQTRSWRNTPLIPDLVKMAKAQEPRLLAEIDRLQAIPRLAAYFDFPRDAPHGGPAWAPATPAIPGPVRGSACGAACAACYAALHVEWLVRDNTFAADGDSGSEQFSRGRRIADQRRRAQIFRPLRARTGCAESVARGLRACDGLSGAHHHLRFGLWRPR